MATGACAPEASLSTAVTGVLDLHQGLGVGLELRCAVLWSSYFSGGEAAGGTPPYIRHEPPECISQPGKATNSPRIKCFPYETGVF